MSALVIELRSSLLSESSLIADTLSNVTTWFPGNDLLSDERWTVSRYAGERTGQDSGISFFKLLKLCPWICRKDCLHYSFPHVTHFLSGVWEEYLLCSRDWSTVTILGSQICELSEPRDRALGHSCLQWLLALTLSLVPKHSNNIEIFKNSTRSPDTPSSQVIFMFLFPRQFLLPCTCHL